ncbi:MAG: hypothetical protein HQL08_15665 [Nitrospirae bacterium]|nr:hypothetical protein [Nitrospirota bacterium]
MINVPFWQDDYSFLLDARKARLEGQPFYAPFFPESRVLFWRPLGMQTYWRFIEGFLGGNVRSAHFVNIILLVASAAAVGWFVATLISIVAKERDRALAGLTSAFLYCIHSSHFLAAAWIAAANDSISVLFSALTLRFWLVVSTADGRRQQVAALMTILCFGLALLSRDIAFVLPAIGLLLTAWIWPQHKPSVKVWTSGVLCVAVSLLWLVARQRFTSTDPVYQLQLGINVARNALLLILFFFNTPFEALRYFFFANSSVGAAMWGIACFLLQSSLFVILIKGAGEQLSRKRFGLLSAFFIIGCAPYFLVSINCYPYYTSLGLFSYAILAGLAARRDRLWAGVVVVAVIASSLSTIGNYFLDSQSHIGRAKWTERQLMRLSELRDAQPSLFSGLIHIVVEDQHKFLGFGVDGLSYRLGIAKNNIIVHNPDDPQARKLSVLLVPAHGDVYFRQGEQ